MEKPLSVWKRSMNYKTLITQILINVNISLQIAKVIWLLRLFYLKT